MASPRRRPASRRGDYDLTTLRLFVAVCDLGNIARAAEREHMVSSAVSKRIAQLEQLTGSTLLERKRYGVRPTSAGETVLAYAREILTTARRLEDSMDAFSAGIQGQVRVLASASVMAAALADDVVAFMQQGQHANIRIDIEERLAPAVVGGIREGTAHLGIVWDRVGLQGLQYRPYIRDQLGVVVDSTHPLAQRPSTTFADTLDWDHVGLPADSTLQRLFEQTAVAHGKRVRSKVMGASFEAAMRVAAARLAICVVPKSFFAMVTNRQGLVHIPLQDDWALRQFVLCFRDETTLSPAARALLGHLSRTMMENGSKPR